MSESFVENMSDEQIERFQKRMYAVSNEYGWHGCSSVTGFLAENETLLDVVKKDLSTLKKHNVDIDMLAQRLFSLVQTAISKMNMIRKMKVTVEDIYHIEINVFCGFQYCPFSDVGENYRTSPFEHIHSHCGRSNMDITITNIKNNKVLTFGSLLVHLIKDHHFFEGSVEHRLDPVKLIDFFDQSKVV